jgi:hypothetical protein
MEIIGSPFSNNLQVSISATQSQDVHCGGVSSLCGWIAFELFHWCLIVVVLLLPRRF